MAGRSRRQVCRASSGATEIFYFLIFFFFLFFSPKSSWPAGHELEDTAISEKSSRKKVTAKLPEEHKL